MKFFMAGSFDKVRDPLWQLLVRKVGNTESRILRRSLEMRWRIARKRDHLPGADEVIDQ
jgi:hypothetical protein